MVHAFWRTLYYGIAFRDQDIKLVPQRAIDHPRALGHVYHREPTHI